jgi:hypothetical protein
LRFFFVDVFFPTWFMMNIDNTSRDILKLTIWYNIYIVTYTTEIQEPCNNVHIIDKLCSVNIYIVTHTTEIQEPCTNVHIIDKLCSVNIYIVTHTTEIQEPCNNVHIIDILCSVNIYIVKHTKEIQEPCNPPLSTVSLQYYNYKYIIFIRVACIYYKIVNCSHCCLSEMWGFSKKNISRVTHRWEPVCQLIWIFSYSITIHWSHYKTLMLYRVSMICSI